MDNKTNKITGRLALGGNGRRRHLRRAGKKAAAKAARRAR